MSIITYSIRTRAIWLPMILLSLGSVVAVGQMSSDSQQATNRIGTSVDTPSQSVQPMSSLSADVKSSLPPTSLSKDYKIGVDDVLNVNVWHEPDLSRDITVRPDGKISLPLIGEIRAAGKTPPQLEDELRSDLAQYVKDPELTVIVAQIRSRRINIIGEVMHPGAFVMTQQMGVLDAIAEAGGLKEFAKKNKIYVLREISAGRRTRLLYDYRDVLSGKHNAQDIILQADDTVVVP